MAKQPQKLKFPILFYEESEPGEPVNPIPYIEMEKEEEFPKVLFVHEYRHTDEFEPDSEGNPSPIVDMLMHCFVDLEQLKDKLDPSTYDTVRVALGMQPLAEASKKGQELLDRVQEKINGEKKQ